MGAPCRQTRRASFGQKFWKAVVPQLPTPNCDLYLLSPWILGSLSISCALYLSNRPGCPGGRGRERTALASLAAGSAGASCQAPSPAEKAHHIGSSRSYDSCHKSTALCDAVFGLCNQGSAASLPEKEAAPPPQEPRRSESFSDSRLCSEVLRRVSRKEPELIPPEARRRRRRSSDMHLPEGRGQRCRLPRHPATHSLLAISSPQFIHCSLAFFCYLRSLAVWFLAFQLFEQYEALDIHGHTPRARESKGNLRLTCISRAR